MPLMTHYKLTEKPHHSINQRWNNDINSLKYEGRVRFILDVLKQYMTILLYGFC